jgi:hypothetical protein
MSWIARLRQRLSDRLWAEDDAFARQAGWTITKTRGRFGVPGRVYRDPRFGQRRARATTTAPPATAPGCGPLPARAMTPAPGGPARRSARTGSRPEQ